MNRRQLLALPAFAALSASEAALQAAEPRDPGKVASPDGGLIFPLDHLHNHGSCLVQIPSGDLLACWYRGSGERRADDVRILGARLKRSSKGWASQWSEPFEMADTPGFPDCNPCTVVDPQGRLRMYWPLIIANQWHTALLMERVADRPGTDGAPKWSSEKPIVLKPGPEFPRIVAESVERDLKRLDTIVPGREVEARAYLELRRKNAADPYFNRMGWMPRAHPIVLEDGRLIVPLYSDGFDFSLMAITDDWGKNWKTSTPIVGAGPVQPALARRKDGTLVAYFRDNGPPPQRLMTAESRDRGETWSPVRDTEILNPGGGSDVTVLKNGHWVLINNDTERGRHRLTVSLSEDEGRTWPWNTPLEFDPSPAGPATYAYPSIIQTRDGDLHATYTITARDSEVKKDEQGRNLREAIKHTRFTEAWIRRNGQPNH